MAFEVSALKDNYLSSCKAARCHSLHDITLSHNICLYIIQLFLSDFKIDRSQLSERLEKPWTTHSPEPKPTRYGPDIHILS